MERGGICITTLISAIVLCAQGSAQITVRASVSSSEGQQNGTSWYSVISADGRYVAFQSSATNLVPGDTNGANDIFVRDRILGTTERVSVSSTGTESNNTDFFAPRLAMSANGQFVTFTTNATNLVPGDTNGRVDIFLRDRQLGTTERVSVDSNEVQGNDRSEESQITSDGRYVVFMSLASNLVAGDTNGKSDIFLRDRQAGTTTRISIGTGNIEANSNNQSPAITPDGRFIAFTSYASNLVPSDLNGLPDVFIRDRQLNTTERISMGLSGFEPDGSCLSSSISADGRFVSLQSDATNLVPGDTNGLWDSFVIDRQTGTTERISVTSSGAQASSWFIQYPAPVLSADGRFAVFVSDATNLVPGDTNNFMDVFLRDRLLGTTTRVSVGTESVQTNENSMDPWISANGRFVSFWSGADNLAIRDTNHELDIFVRDLAPAGFTSTCEPGVAGVLSCPCSNPPSGSGRGCDNSASTGGAVLTASGVAYVTMDSLRFTTSGERSSALSILTQWTGASSTGLVAGMGVRCTSGTSKRLFTKSAVGGSITAPDFLAGDPTVSARSGALGNLITAGSSRWYFVYYRDPVVLGGCAPTLTFNVTQTGRIDWSL